MCNCNADVDTDDTDTMHQKLYGDYKCINQTCKKYEVEQLCTELIARNPNADWNASVT